VIKFNARPCLGCFQARKYKTYELGSPHLRHLSKPIKKMKTANFVFYKESETQQKNHC